MKSLKERVAIRSFAWSQGWKIEGARRFWETMVPEDRDFYIREAAKFIQFVRQESSHDR